MKTKCTKPPTGWICTRQPGHSGPCAAVEPNPAMVKKSDAISAVQCEEELDGPMPDSIWNMLSTRDGAAEVLRANIRATKKNIIKRIQKL